MTDCQFQGCGGVAEFAVRIGSIVGRYCGEHLLQYLQSGNADLPIRVYEAEEGDAIILREREAF